MKMWFKLYISEIIKYQNIKKKKYNFTTYTHISSGCAHSATDLASLSCCYNPEATFTTPEALCRQRT